MSFREKSAWGMGAVMLLTGLLYAFHMSWAVSGDHVHVYELAYFFIAVIVLSIIVQSVLAIMHRDEASQPVDEREEVAIWRAGHWAGSVLAVGAVISVGVFAVHGGAGQLFNGIVGSMIVAQFAQYVFQIALLRRGM